MVIVSFHTDEFLSIRKNYKDKTVGLVPTMGNLHKGHLSLVEKSLRDNDVTIVTIFVNPKQFGEGEDLDKYPRTLGDDIEHLKAVHADYPKKTVIVFAPQKADEIYPEGFDTRVEVDKLTFKLCGASRPGHFSGVTTVVYQLFAITEPDKAYFGMKDYQQLKVIEKMVKDLRLKVNIVPMPIVRDQDGLALSSRNQYLREDERKKSLHLQKTLKNMELVLCSKGFRETIKEINNQYSQAPEGTEWDYLELLDADDLSAPKDETEHFLIAGAMKIGSTRIIDNVRVKINA